MTARHILIVEDEALIAMMLEDFLEEIGFDCVGVVDCVADAVAMIAMGGFDAAIVDVNLVAGEKCWPVAHALIAAGIPFLFATGGGDGSIDPAFADHPRIAKPYTLDGVDAALGALFGTVADGRTHA